MYNLTRYPKMRCCAPFCENTTDNVSPSAIKRISFHGFPHDVRLRVAWLRALGKQDSHLPDSAVVCSQHFLDDDIYETENGLRQICTGAVPSTVQVCMVCLDTDSKLFLMSKHKLEEAYEKLIGHPVCDQRNLKQTICIQCAQKLINFSRFRDNCLRARALMLDLVEKHELITRNHIQLINRTKNQLKSNLEVNMLGPNHCDLYILEDKQTESFSSLFNTSLCTEVTVQRVVVKDEEVDSWADNKDVEMTNEDDNNADSSIDVASNEDLISDNSIMLETRLMDDALRKVLESNRAVAEQVAETMAPLKCESVPLECHLCSEEFVNEHAYMQHMHMHGQIGDRDADCGTSRVCKPHTAVSSSHSTLLTEKKQDIQQLNDDPRPSTDSAQTSVATLHDESPAETASGRHRHIDTASEDFNCQVVSQIKDIGQVTSKVKVKKRKISKTSKSKTNYCSNDGNSKSSLLMEQNLFTCHVCNNTFQQKSLIVDHMKIHTDTKSLTCKFCQFTYKYEGSLKRHMRTHIGGIHTCHLCDYECDRNSDMVKHMSTHTVEIPYSCELCEYKCTQKVSLAHHMRIHIGETYSCELCGYKCTQKRLAQHMRTHTGYKPYSCTLCEYKCTQKRALTQHMRTHTGEKPFSCTLCEYKCGISSNLVHHMRIHTGERPYSCTLCKYKCGNSSNLAKHVRTHTGEKQFSCTLCKFKCIQKSSLVRHTRIHNGEKPYACTLCEYKGVEKIQLLRHNMRTHTGEKP